MKVAGDEFFMQPEEDLLLQAVHNRVVSQSWSEVGWKVVSLQRKD